MDTYDEIYIKHHLEVYHFLLKLTGSQQDISEELTQETFFQGYLSIHKYKGNCHIRTWLFGIAKNVFYKYLRRETKHRSLCKKKHKMNLLNESEERVETLVENQELLSKSLIIIGQFKKRTSEVMVLRIFSDASYKEIALLQGISLSSAKVIFHRGKLALQQELKEIYGYEI